MPLIKTLTFFILLLLSFLSAASAVPPAHGTSEKELKRARQQNHQWHHRSALNALSTQTKPVEDTAQFAYVLMSAYEWIDEVTSLRETIASNLPEHVKLVILADHSSAESIREKYLQWIPAERLIIATANYTRNGFWARDAFPVPVYRDNQRISLVAADYFRVFNAWSAIAESVKAPMVKMDFTFVGGNLLADEDGNCFTVDSPRLFNLNEDDLRYAYGCNEVHMLDYLKGIGDVDEVIKPLPGKRMLTNRMEYKPLLESMGYQVIMLPSLDDEYRTYANALIIDHKVFMPIYRVPEDEIATEVYESLGYEVIPIQSITLSDDYNGSVHCQTMAYPAIDLQELMQLLNATIIP